MKKLLFSLLVSLIIMPIVLSGCVKNPFETKTQIASDQLIHIIKSSYNIYYNKHKSFYNFFDQNAINDGIYPHSIVKNETAYNPWGGKYFIGNLGAFGISEGYFLFVYDVPTTSCVPLAASIQKLKLFKGVSFISNVTYHAMTVPEIHKLCSMAHSKTIGLLFLIGVGK